MPHHCVVVTGTHVAMGAVEQLHERHDASCFEIHEQLVMRQVISMAQFDVLDEIFSYDVFMRAPIAAVRLMLQFMSEVGVELRLLLGGTAAAQLLAGPLFNFIGLSLVQP